MTEINWQDFKCRCSAINKMLSNSQSNAPLTEKQVAERKELESKDKITEKQKDQLAFLINKENESKKVVLSATCIGYLMEEYSWRTQGMVRVNMELGLSQMEKGKDVQGEAIKLLSLVDGVEYIENIDKERIYNDYLSGEIDLHKGKSIMEAEIIGDVKGIWDYPTFLCKISEACSSDNDWQMKGYMDITGAREGFIADCLVDTPEWIILGFKYRLLSKMDVVTDESPAFKKQWEILERSMHFGNIPAAQRVNKKPVELMSYFEQCKVYDKVKICRDWLNKFHETRSLM